MPAVSVIVPHYNHAPYLNWRIDTILNQTFPDFEVLLLDDASTDNSPALIEAYRGRDKVRIHSNTTNSGSVFRQWERGISMTDSDFVWIAESDDWADLRFLETLVPVLRAQPDLALAYSQSWIVNPGFEITGNAVCWTEDLDAQRWKAPFTNEGRDEIARYLVRKNTLPNASAVLQRRSNLSRCLPLQTDFRLCGDWLHWIRMLGTGGLFFTPEPLNFWRLDSSNVRASRPGILEWDEGLRVLRHAGELLGLDSATMTRVEYEHLSKCYQWLRASCTD